MTHSSSTHQICDLEQVTQFHSLSLSFLSFVIEIKIVPAPFRLLSDRMRYVCERLAQRQKNKVMLYLGHYLDIESA